MTEREKNQLKYSANYWLTECELPISKNYEVEYTQEQLDKELQQLKEEGYNNETLSGGKDWYQKNYRVETVTLTSKKIA